MTLQKHVASLRGQVDSASQMLLHLATAARKNGCLPIAMNALHELQASLRYRTNFGFVAAVLTGSFVDTYQNTICAMLQYEKSDSNNAKSFLAGVSGRCVL